jgi:predicted MFS family arabinose efflux permease
MTARSESFEKLQMLPLERRATAALTGIYSTRILGLFLLLPVLDLYVRSLPGATQGTAGFAVGAYALAQGLLQIPAGRLSDRIGRRPVIAGGLLLFIVGSIIGYLTHTVSGVIVARLVQGSGAISAAVTALVADVTRPEVRTRSMAVIGISIGVCFIISLLAGPALDASFGVPGIFACMAVLGVAATLALFLVPQPPARERTLRDSALTASLWRAPLLLTYIGIFAVHFSLTAAFVAVPQILTDVMHLDVSAHWKVYAEVFGASLLITVPLLRVFEKSGRPRRITQLGVALLAAAMLWLVLGAGSAWGMYAGMILFFGAFNFLEAQLPARLSLVVQPLQRGAAMGIFATAQFIGAGIGALLAGQLLKAGQPFTSVFAACAITAAVWLASLVYLHEHDV